MLGPKEETWHKLTEWKRSTEQAEEGRSNLVVYALACQRLGERRDET